MGGQDHGLPEGMAPQRPVEGLLTYLSETVCDGLAGGTCSLDRPLFLRALVHRSYAYEHGGLPHNERLEFLGDAVLGLVVTETLFSRHPELPEGQLAKLRAAVVNTRALADVARTIDLGEYVMLGKGEEATGGRDKTSILADTTEAIIGAVFVSCGMQGAFAFVHHLFDPLIDKAASLGAGLDWKTSLQEIVSHHGIGPLEYHLTESGPDHAKSFRAEVIVQAETVGSGAGRNKKEAEQRAAKQAWETLSRRPAGAPAAAERPGLAAVTATATSPGSADASAPASESA